MADELIFDSERQQQKARRKRWLLPALVLAAVIVLVVVVTLITRSAKPETRTAGENTRYPFTWQSASDGSLRLELPHEDAPDYRWTLIDADELAPVQVVRAEKEKDGKTCFTMTPTEEGRSVIALALLRELPEELAPAAETESAEGAEEEQKSAPPAAQDVIYRMSIQLENAKTEEKLVCTLLSVSGYQLQGRVTGGENSGNPYEIQSDENRNLVLTIQSDSFERDWSCEILSGEASVLVEGILNTGESTQLYLSAGDTPGESELLLKSEIAAVEIRLRCVTQEDGALLLLDRQEQFAEKTAELPSMDNRDVTATTPTGGEEKDADDGLPPETAVP